MISGAKWKKMQRVGSVWKFHGGSDADATSIPRGALCTVIGFYGEGAPGEHISVTFLEPPDSEGDQMENENSINKTWNVKFTQVGKGVL